MNATGPIAYLASYADIIAGTLIFLTLGGLILTIRHQAKLIRASARQMADLQEAVSAYGQTLITSRALLERMEQRITAFTDRNLEIQSQFAFNRSFEEASRLVRDGGSVESLVNGCGLTDAEAALMVRLHQRELDRPRRQWRAKDLRTADGADTQIQAPEETTSGLTSEEIRLRESIRAAQSSR